ncbi:hypothetical protein ACQ33O_06550 [Ferruginibacter sp. SUN002]|uniref:hypothetical protein n=1 Tax=Ferruginibacter sp. SUN002 TaxID=2937789 RepID=UPI003D3660AA
MKKILLSLLAVVTFVVAANAQKQGCDKKMKGGHKQHAMHNNKGMMKDLNLTDAQKQQMKANKEAMKAKKMELSKNENLTVKEYRDKKEALKKEEKAQMMNLLTADQKAKMEQMKKDKKAEHDKKAAAKLEKMKTDLALTDDQVAKIKADKAAFHAKKQAIKDNDNLTRSERKQQLDALKAQNKDSIKKHLTADQIKKMEASKKKKSDKKAA